MKIDSCLIIKNEEENIIPLIEQLLMFSHEIHITDTGSTDRTLEILLEYSSKYDNVFVHYYTWNFNFSDARNYSLTCYDCSADYQFWCDGDDTLNDILIQTLKEFSESNDKTDDVYYVRYQYYDGDPNPHWRTSILKANSNLKWYDPIHEYIQIFTNHNLNYEVFNNGSLILHHKKVSHNSRNLDIFFNMEKTNWDFSSRNRYYYGQELQNHGLTEYAIVQFHKCIDTEDSNFVDPINSCIKLYFCDDSEFIDYFFKLLKKNKIRKDLLYYVGDYYFFKEKNNELAKVYYLMCTNYPNPKLENDFLYDYRCQMNAYLQLNVIEWQMGNIDKSLEYNQLVLEIDPNNQTAIGNINIIKSRLSNTQ